MKPKIKTKTKTIIEVTSSELDRYVGKVYGGRFKFNAMQEASDDTCYSFTVNGDSWLCESEEEEIRKGNYTWICPSNMLNLLYKDGYIEGGEYIIKVIS